MKQEAQWCALDQAPTGTDVGVVARVGDTPVMWHKRHGEQLTPVFCCTLGHSAEHYALPDTKAALAAGITFALSLSSQ